MDWKPFYRVTEIVNSKKKPFNKDSILLNALQGEKIHAAIAESHRGKGKYIEQPLGAIITDKEGKFLTIIIGTCDLYYYDHSKNTNTLLYVIDHKTVSMNAKLYCKSEWWAQLMLYAFFICLKHDNTQRQPLSVIPQVWHYRRQIDLKDSIKPVRVTGGQEYKPPTITKMALKYLAEPWPWDRTKVLKQPVNAYPITGGKKLKITIMEE
jgi:hypothetical protein